MQNPSQDYTILIFHRDFRLEDNRTLLSAITANVEILPIFIFDPAQITTSNEYRSDFSLQFMYESLKDLNAQIESKGGQVYYFYGEPSEIIGQILLELQQDPRGIYFHRDYTPFALQRDRKLAEFMRQKGIPIHIISDLLLNEPEKIQKKQGGPYTVFTPYFKTASKFRVEKPISIPKTILFLKYDFKFSHPIEFLLDFFQMQDSIAYEGGRKQGLELMDNLSFLDNYDISRDIPALDQTSHLSPHLKYGTISIREVYQNMNLKLSESHPLIRQLYWRDFFTQIAFFFPHVFHTAFRKKYTNLPWNTSTEDFHRWVHGMTGFPIVDAGMRQLYHTGTMHNRVRMITASFLVKDLHINWQWGEKHFAQYLIDYDPAINNGNWQWAASTGCDAQPYFRIFNPWLQQKRFDPNCLYIKKWVPELTEIPCKVIHKLYSIKGQVQSSYPSPMVDHKQEVEKTKFIFREISNKFTSK